RRRRGGERAARRTWSRRVDRALDVALHPGDERPAGRHRVLIDITARIPRDVDAARVGALPTGGAAAAHLLAVRGFLLQLDLVGPVVAADAVVGGEQRAGGREPSIDRSMLMGRSILRS